MSKVEYRKTVVTVDRAGKKCLIVVSGKYCFSPIPVLQYSKSSIPVLNSTEQYS
jgi:hypothetical protein